MLTENQKAEIDQAMIEPDDLMDDPDLTQRSYPEPADIYPEAFSSAPTEIDQLAALANAVLMLESAAKEIEASPAGYSVETVAYGIRCRCEGWRENINQRLRPPRRRLH